MLFAFQHGNAWAKWADSKHQFGSWLTRLTDSPGFFHDKAMHEVLARYGVEMRSVAGCVVTDSLLKGVSRSNRAVFAALDKRLGIDAKARIMAEVEGVATTQRRVEEVLRKNASV